MARKAPSQAIPNFVEQYYKTSTFSHLSQWKLQQKQLDKQLDKEALFKKRMRTAMASSSSSSDSTDDELSLVTRSDPSTAGPSAAALHSGSIVVHIDIDCFYVSIAVRDDPSLAGRPVIVAPTPNLSPAAVASSTSEVASCSYEARAKGVSARMFLRDAFALCPDAVFLACQYAKYEEASRAFYATLRQFSSLSEAVSADEAFLDMSTVGWDAVERVVEQIRETVFAAIGCSCSAGIGPNKLLARLATSQAKALKTTESLGAQFVLRQEDWEAFVRERPVEELPSVGPALGAKLRLAGACTIGQLRSMSKTELAVLGPKTSDRLFRYARGVDSRPVRARKVNGRKGSATMLELTGKQVTRAEQRKSVGTQISWGVRFDDMHQAKRFLCDLAQEVAKRLKQILTLGGRLTLMVKKRAGGGEVAAASSKFMNPGTVKVVSKSSRLHVPTCDAAVLARVAVSLLLGLHILPADIRGVGMHVDQLTPGSAAAKSSSRSKGKGKGKQAAKSQATLTSFFTVRKKEPGST